MLSSFIIFLKCCLFLDVRKKIGENNLCRNRFTWVTFWSSRKCVSEQRGSFLWTGAEGESLSYFKEVNCAACVLVAVKLFAQVKLQQHVLYVRKKKKRQRKIMLEYFLTSPGVCCVSPLFPSQTVCHFILFNEL